MLKMTEIIRMVEDDHTTLKIPIYKKQYPFFFIHNSRLHDNYRISTSFKYLNKVFDLKINIIRDISKVRPVRDLLTKADLIYENTEERMSIFKYNYNNEVIFLIQKEDIEIESSDETIGETIVFFGKDYNSIYELCRYLHKIK